MINRKKRVVVVEVVAMDMVPNKEIVVASRTESVMEVVSKIIRNKLPLLPMRTTKKMTQNKN
jgi:hypothetical protein